MALKAASETLVGALAQAKATSTARRTMICTVASSDVFPELRSPPLTRAFYGVVVVAAVLLMFLVPTVPFPLLLTIAFMALAVGALGSVVAAAFTRVRARPEGLLEVRNRLTTRRLQRSDVDRVILRRQGGIGSWRRLELLLKDGTQLPLVATDTLPVPGQRRQLEQRATELRHWLGGRS
ncbi:protein of unknown function [Blastococcus saxobsidens DD2]|uniref:PH domain-containing protein n=1 Tax=Blastococcus saxobsidens (strain DD2) TaxID=1146883 RepID=H6RRY4_BLASD|nr:protein of unknown function [Blastococcus saxobsidens DD2]